ncbi:MAG: MFS transporter, partial [Phycisphaerae bacterium]|nr:MFS transporter [Phycisphaerae bacterium]
ALCRFSDTLLLLRAAELGLAPWSVVLLYALSNCLYAALAYPAGALSDRYGRWPILAAGFAAYLGACVLMALAPHGSVLAPFGAMSLLGIHLALTDGVAKALVADAAPVARRGRALGVYHAVTGLCALASSVGVGLLWDRFGAPTAFLCAVGIGVLALAALPVAARARRPIA